MPVQHQTAMSIITNVDGDPLELLDLLRLVLSPGM